MLDQLKTSVKFVGFHDSMFRFKVTINGQAFDYMMGVGHCSRVKKKDSEQVKFNLNTITVDDKLEITRCLKGYGKRLTVDDFEYLREVYVNVPDLKDILWCLFLDASAYQLCFQDWCSEYGYDDDSIKARKIYEDCIENYFKLKKALGNNFQEIKNHIEGMEL